MIRALQWLEQYQAHLFLQNLKLLVSSVGAKVVEFLFAEFSGTNSFHYFHQWVWWNIIGNTGVNNGNLFKVVGGNFDQAYG